MLDNIDTMENFMERYLNYEKVNGFMMLFKKISKLVMYNKQ